MGAAGFQKRGKGKRKKRDDATEESVQVDAERGKHEKRYEVCASRCKDSRLSRSNEIDLVLNRKGSAESVPMVLSRLERERSWDADDLSSKSSENGVKFGEPEKIR